MIGPMPGCSPRWVGLTFGSQLGQALGQLSKEVLTSTDIGLPLGPAGTAALLPAAIEAFSEGLEQPHREVLVFIAAREAAYQRLYNHVPWLRQRLLATVEDYARGSRWTSPRSRRRRRDSTRRRSPIRRSSRRSCSRALSSRRPRRSRSRPSNASKPCWRSSRAGWSRRRRRGARRTPALCRRAHRDAAPPPRDRWTAEQTFATLVGLELRPPQGP